MTQAREAGPRAASRVRGGREVADAPNQRLLLVLLVDLESLRDILYVMTKFVKI